MERSLHEVLDLDEPNAGLSRREFWEENEALVRVIEQRRSSDPELNAVAADLKAAVEGFAALKRNLDRAYAAGDEESRARVAPFYIRTLFDAGRDDEAFEVIGAARRMPLTEPLDFAMIGGALLKRGHFADSARWYTKGLVRHVGSLAQITLDGMLADDSTAALTRGRRTARQALGVAPDHLDDLYGRYLAAVTSDDPEEEPL